MYKLVPSPNLTFSRFETRSSECVQASSTRSGRVAARSRRYEELALFAPIDDGPLGHQPPRVINLPPGGKNIVLERPGANGGGLDVRSATGKLDSGGPTISAGAHVLAHDDRYYLDVLGYSWAGEPDKEWAGGHLNPYGESLARSVVNGEARSLIVTPAGQTPDHPTVPDYMMAELNRPYDADRLRHLGWQYSVEGAGVGAIDAAGHTVMALPSGRLVVLLPQGDERKYGVLTLDAAIPPNATDLSIVPPYAMVLYGGGDAGKLVADRSASITSSRLEARRPDGSLAWSANAAFLAKQPPIDGNGRVYLVGGGIAAFDLDGKLLWSAQSNVPLRATAFADGTLAVVRGSELQIVAPDGTIRQSFRANEALTTYPAIASDGSVWAASAKMLYQAR
ncbi:PQQ-like beta-propeller repeat protein [Pendulispora brunnea]|uniref:PQQ-like beta-propeller repeat protein n=1 Tax=Pendulispora brunnea TaxID=2905690 RepID=A0ABZ2K5A7_9BACT